jgi:putative peptide zinc metalloprotease protein
VPDLFGRIRPILSGLLPSGRAAGRPSDLRRGARIAVTAWVLVTIPLLVAESAWLAWSLPRLTRTLLTSIQTYAQEIHDTALQHQWAQLALDCVAIGLLVIPAVGLGLLGLRVTGRILRAGARHTRPKPRGRHRR